MASRKAQGGELPTIEFTQNGQTVQGELRLQYVDDEKSKVSDFLFSNPVSITGGVVTGGALVSQIPRMLNNAANQIPFVGSGRISATPKAAAVAAALGVGLIAAGTYYAYANREAESTVQELGKETPGCTGKINL